MSCFGCMSRHEEQVLSWGTELGFTAGPGEYVSVLGRFVRPSSCSRRTAGSTKATRFFTVGDMSVCGPVCSPSGASSTRACLAAIELFASAVLSDAGTGLACAGCRSGFAGAGVCVPLRSTRGLSVFTPLTAPLMAALLRSSSASPPTPRPSAGRARLAIGTPASLHAKS
jgi:hypothetical protein